MDLSTKKPEIAASIERTWSGSIPLVPGSLPHNYQGRGPPCMETLGSISR